MTRILLLAATLAVALLTTSVLLDSPASAQPSQKAVQISAGGDQYTCALLESGGLLCWGLNDVDQALPPEGEYRAVDAGWRHTCAVTAQDVLVCWGRNTEGQSTTVRGLESHEGFGAGVNTTCWAIGSYSSPPTPAWICQGAEDIDNANSAWNTREHVRVAVGRAYACVTHGASLLCVGDNTYGQSSGPEGAFVSIDAGDDFTCAITAVGAISCWGRSIHGQADAPQGRYLDIATGAEHACGIAAAGSIRCWGRNSHEQTDALSGTNWELAAAGGSHSCAVNEDGKVGCWGRNYQGQLNVPASIAVNPMFTVDVSASPQEGGSVEGAGAYRRGRTARLTATPASGYRFVRWIGDASGTASSVRLTVDDDKTATAVFDLIDERDDTPMIEDGAMTAAFPTGRIVARRLDDGRTEFGYQPQGDDRILPAQRSFPANATVDRWLNSGPVIVDGEEVGRINARLLADGRIEFGFTPTGGVRILPASRYFPVSSSGGWLRSSLIGN